MLVDVSQKSAPPVLLWQMGKVASTSIHEALLLAGVPVIKVHVLNRATLAERKRRRAEHDLPPAPAMLEADRLEPLIVDPSVRFKVISAVRDPVARNLATMFQRWNDFPLPEDVDRKDPDAIAAWFIKNAEHDDPLTWFQREFEARFDIDVFALDPHKLRAGVPVNAGRLEFVILRTEDNAEVKDRAVNNLLNRHDLRLEQLNQTKDKPIGPVYEAVKASLRLSGSLLDYYYNSRFAKHFYGDGELAEFRKRWAKTS